MTTATLYAYDPSAQDYTSGSDTHNVNYDDIKLLLNTGEFGMKYQYLIEDGNHIIGAFYSDSPYVA